MNINKMMLQWLLLSSLEVLIANSMYFNGDYFVKIDFSPKLTDSMSSLYFPITSSKSKWELYLLKHDYLP